MERLHGIYGVYIANVYESERRKQFEAVYSDSTIDDDSTGESNPSASFAQNNSANKSKKAISMNELVKQHV